MNDQIPLYLGIPLAVFLTVVTILFILMAYAIWKDYHE